MRNGSETVNTVLQELGNDDGSEVKYKDITIKLPKPYKAV